MNEKIARFLAEQQPATPCLVVDLDIVEENFRSLSAALPDAKIYYAVKANPAPEILSRLTAKGASFDTASLGEIEMALAAGATPERISFGTPSRSSATSRRLRAGRSPVRLRQRRGARQDRRVRSRQPGLLPHADHGEGAEWPLSRKFGCDASMAGELVSGPDGLSPYGISFHVGWQQKDPTQWDRRPAPWLRCSATWKRSASRSAWSISAAASPPATAPMCPGGLWHDDPQFAPEAFRHRLPETIVEPGRSMVGDAGVIQSEVVLISRKSANDNRRWVYLDIGKFGGLAETMDEAIQYPIPRRARRHRSR